MGIDKTKLANKDVLLKVVGIEHTFITKLSSVEEDGIWVQHAGLISELKNLAKHEGMPIFLGKNPAVFVPFARLEWMMVAGEHIR